MTLWVRILHWIFKVQRAAYQHRRYSLSFVAILVTLVGWAAFDVKNSNDPMLFFSEDNLHRQKLEKLQNTFGTSQATLLVLDAHEAGAPINLLEAERYLSEILLDATNPLHINHLTSLGSATSTLPSIGYPSEYTSLEEVAFLAADHPALSEFFFNEDQSATMLILSLDLKDQSDLALKNSFIEQMELVGHMQDRYPDLSISIVGSVTTFEALREAFEYDSKYFFPATFLVNFLVLLFAFGNLRVTLSVLFIAVVSVIMTRGVAGWSGYVFAAGSASAFSIVFTLTVASLIHIVHAMGQRMRALPFQRSHTIILSSFRKLTVPVLLAHVTTAVGFLSLNWADSPSFNAMGNLVALGLMFSLLLSLFVAPIALKSKRVELKIRDDRIRRMSRWLANEWARAPIRNAVIVTLLSVASLAGLTKIEFDDRLIKNFPEDHPLHVNINAVLDAFGWSQSIDFVLRFDEDELTKPEAFSKVATITKWIEELDGVTGVSSALPLIEDCLQTRNPPFTGKIANAPEKMLNYCIRTGTKNSGFFDDKLTQTRLTIMIPKTSARGIRKLSEQIEAYAVNSGLLAHNAEVSGVAVMSAYLSKVNTTNMLTGSAIAMLVVSMLIGLFLRSSVLALLSILPNFLPAMAALGLWVWLNGEVGMAASIIAAVTFGIVVDDTIHILYALARGKNTKTRNGIKNVLRKVTPGVLTTTATLGFGFLILIASGFEVNRQLGFLTGMTIWIAFFFDIFVLPGLYKLLKGKKR